jgi:hypothetical protein
MGWDAWMYRRRRVSRPGANRIAGKRHSMALGEDRNSPRPNPDKLGSSVKRQLGSRAVENQLDLRSRWRPAAAAFLHLLSRPIGPTDCRSPRLTFFTG